MANTPNQPAQGQQPPQGQQNQQHAALTAAGVPQEHAAMAAQHGITPQQAADLVKAGVNWQAVFAAIAQYGPQFLAMLMAILNKGPVPTP